MQLTSTAQVYMHRIAPNVSGRLRKQGVQMIAKKMEYVAPTVNKVGSFEEITQANGTSFKVDVAFGTVVVPPNTPFS